MKLKDRILFGRLCRRPIRGNYLARLVGDDHHFHVLGHKSAVLTLDKYGHLFPDDLDAVADAFNSAADALRTVPALNIVVGAGNSR